MYWGCCRCWSRAASWAACSFFFIFLLTNFTATSLRVALWMHFFTMEKRPLENKREKDFAKIPKTTRSHFIQWRVKFYLKGSDSNILLGLYFLVFFFYWSIVDLQCCVSIRCTATWFGIFFRFFSIIDYYKILNIVSCAIQQVLVVYPFIFSRVYTVILTFSLILPHAFPFGNHKFVFYVCEPNSVL